MNDIECGKRRYDSLIIAWMSSATEHSWELTAISRSQVGVQVLLSQPLIVRPFNAYVGNTQRIKINFTEHIDAVLTL
jgi:hypothetical protein